MSPHHALTPGAAHAASAFAACSYVAVLYLFPSTRTRPSEVDQNGRRLDRLHPDILKARLWAVSVSSLCSVLLVGVLARASADLHYSSSIGETLQHALALTGLKTPHIGSIPEYIRLCIQPVILTTILFLGALYTKLVLEPKAKTDGPCRSFKDIINIYVVRTLILGPLFEEIVYRGCIIAFHLLVSSANQPSKTKLIFTTPLWFGFAHVHGIWETYRSLAGRENALMIAILQATVQFTYTTIFGWYAAFIYLRTGSVISATLCHSFCNYMGLPPIFDSMQRFPNKRIAILMYYLIGIIAFGVLLRGWASDPALFPSSSPFWTNTKIKY
ncbi:hypothetical protein PTTG_07582 [Puccinia triticina 1-1 BBBD Race 1]|uniref:intramembrane prenyl-peptidase Rce1 n=2 Tax=Puccinia triticina TaxID=208348 RepID=A0A180G6X4_PUCT1|nr:uncharacterized protein PtA15_5A838 [Puccinia triticina]OAV88318.1 hypothetical protein PTTG_07582 [Puccinia triticina 1-1 BBBD Race 1]WAQ85263.1 hypothetical protein PtA15_5A838 [Puccinia triticina]WAR58585.1 hypothetical protein PtB15_5B819 [Puccinia triticina]